VGQGLGFALGLKTLEHLGELLGYIDAAGLAILGACNAPTYHIAADRDTAPLEINVSPLQG
jgi:hypothetical protein